MRGNILKLGFSDRLKPTRPHTILIVGREAGPDVTLGLPVSNIILGGGFPRSFGAIKSAFALFLAFRIKFELSPLDLEPYYHGYGSKCSETKIILGIQDLSIVDMNGKVFKI